MSAVLVKVCGITSPDDALACVAEGVDLIGLNFVGGPRRISLQQGVDISKAVLGYARLVGVFADQHVEEIQSIAARCSLDYVQLHGFEDQEYISKLGNLRVIKAVRLTENCSLDEVLGIAQLPNVSYMLVDAYKKGNLGGTGQLANWPKAAALRAAMDELGLRSPGYGFRGLAIAGGLGPGNVGRCVEAVGPDMVDLNSAVENEPGKKDRQKVASAVLEVRGVESNQGRIDRIE